MRGRTLVPLLALTLGLAAGCSRGDAPPTIQGTTTGAGMAVDFRTDEVPASGINLLEVKVTKDGAPVDGAKVTVRFSMPAMPSMNMPEMHSDATLESVGEGRYRGTGELSMDGTWNVLITVTRDGQELATSSLSIVAD
jgi:nitrogen fixation protein FixH